MELKNWINTPAINIDDIKTISAYLYHPKFYNVVFYSSDDRIIDSNSAFEIISKIRNKKLKQLGI